MYGGLRMRRAADVGQARIPERSLGMDSAGWQATDAEQFGVDLVG